jgi:broad specificity phosphatase PhoE
VSGEVPPHLARMVLVRHGEAEGNRELRYLGDHNAPLTERGLAQAEQVAAAIQLFGIETVYTSPLGRALETARAIARVAKRPLRVEPDLREMSYGAWEGLLHAEVVARDPELLRQWASDPDTAPPGGESLRAMCARAVACADRIARAQNGLCIVLVSHVGPVKALICHVLGLGVDSARRMWLDPATISVVDWPLAPDSTGALRLFNSFAHLDDGVRWLP